jgi:hypothetical protein
LWLLRLEPFEDGLQRLDLRQYWLRVEIDKPAQRRDQDRAFVIGKALGNPIRGGMRQPVMGKPPHHAGATREQDERNAYPRSASHVSNGQASENP